jgi:hypothetical protein
MDSKIEVAGDAINLPKDGYQPILSYLKKLIVQCDASLVSIQTYVEDYQIYFRISFSEKPICSCENDYTVKLAIDSKIPVLTKGPHFAPVNYVKRGGGIETKYLILASSVGTTISNNSYASATANATTSTSTNQVVQAVKVNPFDVLKKEVEKAEVDLEVYWEVDFKSVLVDMGPEKELQKKDIYLPNSCGHFKGDGCRYDRCSSIYCFLHPIDYKIEQLRNALPLMVKNNTKGPYAKFYDLESARLFVARLLRSYETFKKDPENINIWGTWFAGAILAIDSSPEQ